MPAIYGILVAGNFISCVGLWHFKQWGVTLYLLDFIARLIFFISIQQLSFGFWLNSSLSLLSSIAIIRFYPKMDPNL